MEALENPELIDILMPLLAIIFVIALGVVFLYQHFQKNLFLHKLHRETMKNLHQGELLRGSIHAQEEERKRIALDIHDELGAALSITRMNMIMLEKQSGEIAPGLLPGLQNARVLIESALASMRSISHRLLPPQLEAFGLIKTLESVIEQINRTSAIDFQLSSSIQSASMPWPICLGLYRIVMELVNNTVKHSGASVVRIEIFEQNEYIVCSYADNGRGCTRKETGNGLGYKSIDSRISALHGSFEFTAKERGGFAATIHIPLFNTAL